VGRRVRLALTSADVARALMQHEQLLDQVRRSRRRTFMLCTVVRCRHSMALDWPKTSTA
jgi:hypothetical protein